MDISWYGQSCFRLKGKSVSVVTDPYNAEEMGVKKLKVAGDIVTVSHQHMDHNDTEAVEGSPFVVSGSGEYDIKGVRIQGVQTFHDTKEGKERGRNTVFMIEIDGVTVCHCGDLGHELSTSQLELIEDVDILLVPVGGVYTIGPTEAIAVINQLEPKVIIPMHYGVSGFAEKLNLGTVEQFLHVFGKGTITPVSKYSVTKDKLPDSEEIVVLEM